VPAADISLRAPAGLAPARPAAPPGPAAPPAVCQHLPRSAGTSRGLPAPPAVWRHLPACRRGAWDHAAVGRSMESQRKTFTRGIRTRPYPATGLAFAAAVFARSNW